MGSGVHRNGRRTGWRTAATVFTLAGALSAAVVGGILGRVGGLVSEPSRHRLMTILAAIGVMIAVFELVRRRPVWLPQRSRETPKRWLDYDPVTWALLNGAALGVGASSRIEFWLWYVVPLGAFLSGSVLLGIALYAVYGLGRVAGVWAILLAPETRRRGLDSLALRLVRRIPDARILARAQLLMVCGLILIAAQ